MKKILILAGLVLAVISGLFINNVFGTSAVTTTTLNAQSTTYNGQVYYYDDYQDLISQIYEDVHDDIYSQIYDDVIDQLTSDYYDEVYEAVEAELLNLLSQEEFDLYINDFQDDIHQVVALAETSVFGVTSYTGDGSASLGSGVVYKYDEVNDIYYIITNYHVVEDGIDFEVYLPDASTVDANLIGYDTEVDIAILTFSGVGLSNIVVSPLGNSDDINVSEFVLAVGNPQGYTFYNSVNLGIVSGLERKVDSNRYVDYIQHDAAINSGNSGGPIYNLNGEVIGINVSKYAEVDIEGMGFAIPINIVKEIIARIEADDLDYNTIMPRIGASYYIVEDNISESTVTLNELTIDSTVHNDITITLPSTVTDGIIVNSIVADGTLDGYLTSGDLIVSIDSFNISDNNSFQDYLYANYQSGDSITIGYYDYNDISNSYYPQLITLTVELK